MAPLYTRGVRHTQCLGSWSKVQGLSQQGQKGRCSVVDLTSLTLGELSTLYNDTDEDMRTITGKWSWPVLKNPLCRSRWLFLLSISSEMSTREVEEDGGLPDWMEGEVPEWLLDVDGGGTTGYTTDYSNVPF